MNILPSIFGSKPNYGSVQSPYQQVTATNPNTVTNTNLASGNITSYLSGLLPPDVMNQIKNAGAAWGANSGLPGSGAAGNVSLESLGLNSLSEMQQGQSDYLNFVTGLGSQMMPVSEQVNAANAAAAPDPGAAGLWNTGMGIIGTIAGGELSGGSSWQTAGTTSYTGGTGGSGGSSFSQPAPFGGFDTSSMSDLYGTGGDSGIFNTNDFSF